MKIERSRNAISGTVWGVSNRIVCTLMPFIIRTVIIRQLGTEYLGLNSLFTAILHVLNLSELGLSNAIVYHMYKPVAEDNYPELGALLNLYRKLYYIVGMVILVGGLICLPFLPKLINGTYPNEINIYVLYILFLANTCASYFFFAYKESVLFAYQRIDTINKIRLASFFGMYLVQIIILIVCKNYYVYAGIMTVFTIARCVWTSFIVNKKYPMIKCGGNVSKDSIESIKKITFGAAIGKICASTRGSCDDIVISAFIGLTPLAMFDNYYYIISAITAILYVMEQALSVGVGNSIVVESQEKNYNDFLSINFLFMWIVGWFSICLLCLYQPFMELWVGSDLKFSNGIMILFCIYFFAAGTSSIPSVYANANGLWWKMRYKSIMEVILNLVLNITLVQFMGIQGILIATILTLVFISFIWANSILHKNYFTNFKQIKIVKNQIIYALVTMVVAIVTYAICTLIKINSPILTMLVRIPLCIIVPNSLFLLCYHKTQGFAYGKRIVLQKMRKRHSS